MFITKVTSSPDSKHGNLLLCTKLFPGLFFKLIFLIFFWISHQISILQGKVFSLMPFQLPFLSLLSPYQWSKPTIPLFFALSFLSSHPHQAWTFPSGLWVSPWYSTDHLNCVMSLLPIWLLPWRQTQPMWRRHSPLDVSPAELGWRISFAGILGRCTPTREGHTWKLKFNDHPLNTSKNPNRHYMKTCKALKWTTGWPERRMEMLGLACSALDIRDWILLSWIPWRNFC